jgi:hypothetical protein
VGQCDLGWESGHAGATDLKDLHSKMKSYTWTLYLRRMAAYKEAIQQNPQGMIILPWDRRVATQIKVVPEETRPAQTHGTLEFRTRVDIHESRQ